MLLLQKPKMCDFALAGRGHAARKLEAGNTEIPAHGLSPFGTTVTGENLGGRPQVCLPRLLLQATQLEGVRVVMCWALLSALDNVFQERDELQRDLADQP